MTGYEQDEALDRVLRKLDGAVRVRDGSRSRMLRYEPGDPEVNI